jgi:hypothetical protein
MDVTKPCKFIWFGDIHDPKPYKSIGFRWAFILQTPVVQDLWVASTPEVRLVPPASVLERCAEAGAVNRAS